MLPHRASQLSVCFIYTEPYSFSNWHISFKSMQRLHNKTEIFREMLLVVSEPLGFVQAAPIWMDHFHTKRKKISGVQCKVFSINGNMNVIAELCYAGWLYAAEGNLTQQNFALLSSPRLKVWSDACSTRKIIRWLQQMPLRAQSSIRQAAAKTSPLPPGEANSGAVVSHRFPQPLVGGGRIIKPFCFALKCYK